MSWRLAEIYRHPVKSVGAEALDSVTLEVGRAMPHDRIWAIAHGGSTWRAEAPAWVGPNNFLRVTHVPELARVAAGYDADTGLLRLTHPDRPEISVDPRDAGGERGLSEWVAPLAAARRPGPYRVAEVPGRAMTDVPEPWVSVLSLASLRALGAQAGRELDPRRFRGNLWIEGAGVWDEESWPGKTLAIGDVRLEIVERIGRCRATEAGPESGDYDAPTLAALRDLRGETAFGVYARIVTGGMVRTGDPARLA